MAASTPVIVMSRPASCQRLAGRRGRAGPGRAGCAAAGLDGERAGTAAGSLAPLVCSTGLTAGGCGPAVDGACLAREGTVLAGPGTATRAAATGGAVAADLVGGGGVVVADRVGTGAAASAGAEIRGKPFLARSRLAADAAIAAGVAGCVPAGAVRV